MLFFLSSLQSIRHTHHAHAKTQKHTGKKLTAVMKLVCSRRLRRNQSDGDRGAYPRSVPHFEQQSRSKTDAASRKNKEDARGDAGAMQAQIGTPASSDCRGFCARLFSLVPSLREGVSAAAFRSDSDDLTTEFAYSCLFTLSCLGLVGVFDFTVGQFLWPLVAVCTRLSTLCSCGGARRMHSSSSLYPMRTLAPRASRRASHAPCTPPVLVARAAPVARARAFAEIDRLGTTSQTGRSTSMCIYFQWGPMQGFSLFWALMGIPGMVDYGSLVGVK